MSTVGERILIMRKHLGLTQEELAKRMGYKSKSTINKIEMGINDIPQSKIVMFAKALGTTPAYLMGWNDVPKETPPSPTIEELSEGEKALLELFKRVPEDQQNLVLQMIRAALGSQQ
jgi:transcriptional regulator with XRE-family HTH domain